MFDVKNDDKPPVLRVPFHAPSFLFDTAIRKVGRYVPAQVGILSALCWSFLAFGLIKPGFLFGVVGYLVCGGLYLALQLPWINRWYVQNVSERVFCCWETDIEEAFQITLDTFYDTPRHLRLYASDIKGQLDMDEAERIDWYKLQRHNWTIGYDEDAAVRFMHSYKENFDRKLMFGDILIKGNVATFFYYDKELRGQYSDIEDIDEAVVNATRDLILASVWQWEEAQKKTAEESSLTVGDLRKLIAAAPDNAKLVLKNKGGLQKAEAKENSRDGSITTIELSL